MLSINLAEDPFFGFGEVLESIRHNETSVEIIKKVLSAAAAISARSDNGPTYLLWTLPTTLFAILGLVYFFGKSFIPLQFLDLTLQV